MICMRRVEDLVDIVRRRKDTVAISCASPEDGEKVMIRVQRELTRRFFMHNNERVLITFSAGIAVRQPDEPQEMLIGRADRAMYEAKRAGKNRVQRAADDIG